MLVIGRSKFTLYKFFKRTLLFDSQVMMNCYQNYQHKTELISFVNYAPFSEFCHRRPARNNTLHSSGLICTDAWTNGQEWNSWVLRPLHIGRCRLPGRNSIKYHNQWLEILNDMVRNRSQWWRCIHPFSFQFVFSNHILNNHSSP